MKHPEKYRATIGNFGTAPGTPYGLFFVKYKNNVTPLKILCAPAEDEWQHVSVSMPNRCPTWEEMAYIKSLFWDDSETVIQFHPSKEEYINNHPYVLHLWKHKDGHVLPPSILVGFKTLN